MGDDRVDLTDREREALAGLAEQIGDPWLARQLVGVDTPSPNEPSRAGRVARQFSSKLASVSGWVGLALVLVGAVLAVTTFAGSTVVGSLGLLVMGAGIWRLAVDRSDVIVRRLKARRVPVSVPPPPRTPPVAS